MAARRGVAPSRTLATAHGRNVLQICGHVLDVVEQTFYRTEQFVTGIGKFELASGSVQKPNSQFRFEISDERG